MITNHTQLLNWLVDKYKLNSYLEVGVQSVYQNFSKIKVPSIHKVGVDPDPNVKYWCVKNTTSDQYFADYSDTFDLIFLDGDHTKEQIERDFNNAMKCLNTGGVVVIHDSLPENERGTIVPRETRQWWGSVYKFVMKLDSIPNIKHYTVNMDNGCTVVYKSSRPAMPTPFTGKSNRPSWQDYLDYKDTCYNIIQPSEIETYL